MEEGVIPCSSRKRDNAGVSVTTRQHGRPRRRHRCGHCAAQPLGSDAPGPGVPRHLPGRRCACRLERAWVGARIRARKSTGAPQPVLTHLRARRVFCVAQQSHCAPTSRRGVAARLAALACNTRHPRNCLAANGSRTRTPFLYWPAYARHQPSTQATDARFRFSLVGGSMHDLHLLGFAKGDLCIAGACAGGSPQPLSG